MINFLFIHRNEYSEQPIHQSQCRYCLEAADKGIVMGHRTLDYSAQLALSGNP